MNPQISAILTNYNGAPFIAQAVESVLAQTRAPAEIVVADDGSGDESQARVSRYLGKITWLGLPHMGQAQAVAEAVRHAKGPWLAFLETDDVWKPEKLAEAAAMLDKEPGLIAVQHEMDQVDIELKPLSTWRTDELRKWSLNDFLNGRTLLTGMSALLVRKDAMEKLLPFPKDLVTCVDEYIQPRLLKQGPWIHLPRTLGLRRIHGANFYGGVDRDPVRLARYIELRQSLDAHLRAFLKETGTQLAPAARRAREMERKKLELINFRNQNEWRRAFFAWAGLVKASGLRPYTLFKVPTSLIMLLDPELYGSIQDIYASQRWLYRIRDKVFPG